MNKLYAAMPVVCCFLWTPCHAQDTNARKPDAIEDCPLHQEHTAEAHRTTVERHGDQAMGFAHDKTTHQFRLTAHGGVLEVKTNDADDRANAARIRSHLSHIAESFKAGDFSTPTLIHDGVPPGATTMKLMKSAIRYEYADVPSGGRVRITSGNPVAVAAIHDFFRFQINEHHTGDTMETKPND